MRYFIEVYSAGVNAFPRQRCFLSEDMFGGTLQGEMDQNTVATLTSTVSPVALLDQR